MQRAVARMGRLTSEDLEGVVEVLEELGSDIMDAGEEVRARTLPARKACCAAFETVNVEGHYKGAG